MVREVGMGETNLRPFGERMRIWLWIWTVDLWPWVEWIGGGKKRRPFKGYGWREW